jgi:Protein of unknown function (DUF3102)
MRSRPGPARSIEDIIEIGQELIAQKAALPGQFLAWVEAEFGWQERMARRFMAIANKFGDADRRHIAGLRRPCRWLTYVRWGDIRYHPYIFESRSRPTNKVLRHPNRLCDGAVASGWVCL